MSRLTVSKTRVLQVGILTKLQGQGMCEACFFVQRGNWCIYSTETWSC
uniref:Uncharacterized protein n=1 Tax=Anguilla anguilla TaxID=7936 RepID=A0A0E9TAA6_ANGAN